jgi:hypothetical protein
MSRVRINLCAMQMIRSSTWAALSLTFLIGSSRMLKKSASGVLAALRGSTYRSVRLASSLAAALLNGLFEHPA